MLIDFGSASYVWCSAVAAWGWVRYWQHWKQESHVQCTTCGHVSTSEPEPVTEEPQTAPETGELTDPFANPPQYGSFHMERDLEAAVLEPVSSKEKK